MELNKKIKLAALLKRLGGNADNLILELITKEIGVFKEFFNRPSAPPTVIEKTINKTVVIEGKKGDAGKNADPVDTKPIIEEVKRELLPFMLQRGGSPNRQISVNSTVIGQPYNDFNFIGSIAGIPNNTTKQTDVYFDGGGGGTPAEPDMSMQFNDAGSFGGSLLKYDKTQEPGIASFFTDNGADIGGDAVGLNINAGDALLGDSSGGQIQINAGDSTGENKGARFTGRSGSNGDYHGASFRLTGADPADDNLGGEFEFFGGNVDSGTTGKAGGGSFHSGDGPLVGGMDFIGGNATLSGSEGGVINFRGGTGNVTDVSGGDLNLFGGEATGVGTGGDISLSPGGSQTGTPGNVQIIDSVSDIAADFDTSLLSTSDKVFVFNDSSGGFVVANGNTTTSAPSTTATPIFTSYYGGNTKTLGDPVAWIAININGTTYKLPLYT